MGYKLSGFFSGLVVMFVLTASVAAAQTPNASDLISRMQAIGEQMKTLQTEFASLTTQLQALSSGTVLGAQTSTPSASTGPIFTEDLSYGATNDDIKRIQRLLATDSDIYPYGVASGFFGPKTEEAINNLQVRFGYDPVGVIGPATTAMLEGWMRAYPNENYPDGVLSTRPTAATGNTSSSESSNLLARLQAQLEALADGSGTTNDDEDDDEEESSSNSNRGTIPNNPAKSITVAYNGDTATVEIEYRDDDTYDDERFTIKADNEADVVEELDFLTFLSPAEIRDVIVEVSSGSSRGGDEDDAEEAIEAAEDAIDDANDEIDDAKDDDDETDYAEDLLDEAENLLDEAEEAFDDEDYDEAIILAEEAEDKAKDAEDAIGEKKRDAGDIDSIEVEINGTNDAEVQVEYDDGDDESFDLNEDDREDLIEAIAEKLDIDEDDVEDLIEFDYGDIDSIDAEVHSKETDVDIEFESGVEASFEIDETDEDDIIEAIADLYDLDEDDIEDVIDFD